MIHIIYWAGFNLQARLLFSVAPAAITLDRHIAGPKERPFSFVRVLLMIREETKILPPVVLFGSF